MEDHEPMMLPYLSDEIVHDILVRLPGKSLLRFKAVCKPWYALISDPLFAKLHLQLAIKRGDNFNNLERHGVLYFESDDRTTRLAFISFADSGRGVVKSLDHPFEKDQHPQIVYYLHLFGSCNGLLLVCDTKRETFLWNPTTREIKKYSSSSNFSVGRHGYHITGLGYNSSRDEYKAITAFRTNSTSPNFLVPENLVVCICSSISNGVITRMTYFSEFPYNICHTKLPGVTVNGHPHWAVSRISKCGNYRPNKAIICFDMAMESFKEIARPDTLTSFSNFDIAVLRGLLCVVDNYGCDEFHVWAMKEYCVKESWTKLFIIPIATSYLNPLGFINDRKLLIHHGIDQLMIYDLQSGKKDYINPSSRSCTTSVATYVESLVFPNGRVGVKRQTANFICGSYKRKREN